MGSNNGNQEMFAYVRGEGMMKKFIDIFAGMGTARMAFEQAE